jgi:hypothetical protein
LDECSSPVEVFSLFLLHLFFFQFAVKGLSKHIQHFSLWTKLEKTENDQCFSRNLVQHTQLPKEARKTITTSGVFLLRLFSLMGCPNQGFTTLFVIKTIFSRFDSAEPSAMRLVD